MGLTVLFSRSRALEEAQGTQTQQTHKAAAIRTRYSAPKNELLLDSVRRFLEYVILIKFGGRGRYNDDVYVQKYNTFG